MDQVAHKLQDVLTLKVAVLADAVGSDEGISFTISGGNANGSYLHNLGGGMHNYNSSPALTNCTFWDNWAQAGGGMFNYSSSPVLTNCTFWGNWADRDGGGMYNGADSASTVTNCILWGDTPDEIYNSNSSALVSYSDVSGGYPGWNNIARDPMFVSANNGDFHLQTGSLCVDKGKNGAPNLPDYDFEGDPRILDGDRDGTATVDMGVDEMGRRLYLPLVARNH